MSTLFGLDFRETIGAAMAGQLLPATLHKGASAPGANGDTVTTWADYPAEGVRTKWASAVVAEKGYTRDTVKLLLLQRGLGAAPSVGDEATIAGKRWRVVDVSADAGDATWSLAAVPSAGV